MGRMQGCHGGLSQTDIAACMHQLLYFVIQITSITRLSPASPDSDSYLTILYIVWIFWYQVHMEGE